MLTDILDKPADHNCPHCDGRGFILGWENSLPACETCKGYGSVDPVHYVLKEMMDYIISLSKNINILEERVQNLDRSDL